jgi:hypothetical protein
MRSASSLTTACTVQARDTTGRCLSEEVWHKAIHIPIASVENIPDRPGGSQYALNTGAFADIVDFNEGGTGKLGGA